MNKFVISALVIATSSLALAKGQNGSISDFTSRVRNSGYNEGGRHSADFTIMKNGNTLVFTDLKQHLTYTIDLANPGKQSVPSSYLIFLARNSSTSTISTVIDNVSVENIHAGSKGEIISNLIVDIRYQSDFGVIQTQIVSEAKAIAESGPVVSRDDQGQVREEWSEKITGSIGRKMRLVNFRSSFGDTFDRVAGAVLDLGLRIGSLGLQSEKTIYPISPVKK